MFKRVLLFLVLSVTLCVSSSSADINDVAIDVDKLTKVYIAQKSQGELPSDTICSATLYHCLQTSDWELGKKAYADLQSHFRQCFGMFYNSAFEMFLSICVDKLYLTVSENDVRSYLKMRMSTSGDKRRVIGKIIYETGIAVNQLGDISLAVELLEQFLEYEDDIEPIYFNRYLMDIGWAYNKNDMPQKAYMAFKKSAEYYRDKLGVYSKSYANALNAMAYVCRYIARDEERMGLLQTEKDILEHKGDTLGEKYAICLDNIASTYFADNKTEVAIEYAERARSCFERCNSKEHMAIVYNNLSSLYSSLAFKDTCYLSKAEELLTKSLEIDPRSSAIVNLIQFYDEKRQDYDKALKLIDTWEGESKHSIYADVVANHYAHTGEFATYTQYMREYIDYLRSVLQKNALFMSAEERNRYVKFFQEDNLMDLFERAVDTQDTKMAELCFDYLLMTRSLLLSFDSSIKTIIERTKNRELKDMYFNLLVHRKSFEAGQITQERLELYEHDFLERLAKEKNFTDFTSLKAEDVRRQLGDEDVAIEFYKNASDHAASLYAVILDSNTDPKVVTCCTSAEEHILLEHGMLAEFISEKLATEFEGKKRVYFTPSGILYTYPFESEIVNRWPSIQFYRLTSSRELVLPEHHRGSGALIYGGLEYGMGVEDMIEDSLRYAKKERGFDFASPLRYADQIEPLPGTLKEAELIKETYDRQKGTKATLFTGLEGTESSFKSSSGKGVRIIHIGTHGFFITEEKSNAQDPLTRTGLLMSGAENYFYEDDIQSGHDDGILTALEISFLDFRGLDLVTLSACETAKGDITGDGVFGLQRGFKKAGANSILMSLWKVDDEATCKLMTEFYSNWITHKMTKHAALEAAKKTVRETPGWEDPMYWAAFILLDGLD